MPLPAGVSVTCLRVPFDVRDESVEVMNFVRVSGGLTLAHDTSREHPRGVNSEIRVSRVVSPSARSRREVTIFESSL